MAEKRSGGTESDELRVKVRYVSPASLLPAARNPRVMPEHDMEALKRSLQRFGFVEPIIVRREDGRIVGGHQRVQAAMEIGLSRVPVVEIDIEEIDALILNEALNRVHGDWDEAALALHQDEIRLGGGDLSLTGFTEDELRLYADRLRPSEGLTDEDEVPEPPEEPTSKIGDLWLCGEHRLLCGDATKAEDVERLMAREKAGLLLTDPPYGISVVKGLRSTLGGSKPVTIGSIRHRRTDTGGGVKAGRGTDGASNAVDANLYMPIHGDDKPFDPAPFLGLAEQAIIWGGNYCASRLPDSRCWLVWDKNNTGNFADAELAWTSFGKGVRLYRHTWNGLVREGSRDEEGIKRIHPTQKPVGMFGTILEDFTSPGAIVLDPFLGSGTTMIACEKLGRRCFGMELEPKYVDVAVRRWEAYSGKEARRE